MKDGRRIVRWFAGLVAVAFMAAGCEHKDPVVVIYTSQDQQFAEPIFRAFEREAGIKVRALYDSEAVKTVGLANRLVAESRYPQCDVWWSNESLRTRQMARMGILETNALAEFGFRTRRLVINTNLIAPAAAPRSLLELTNMAWKGRVALAYPMFGTTSAHFIALRQHWGAHAWESWCRALATNEPFLVDGNSVVVQLVGRGEAAVGLTDVDDVAAGQRQGWPVLGLPVTPEMLVIPNTVAVVRSAPHPAEAQRLFDYLRSEPVLRLLVAANALEPGSPDAAGGLRGNWDELVDELPAATTAMRAIFLR